MLNNGLQLTLSDFDGVQNTFASTNITPPTRPATRPATRPSTRPATPPAVSAHSSPAIGVLTWPENSLR